jgi:hypothetical protein
VWGAEGGGGASLCHEVEVLAWVGEGGGGAVIPVGPKGGVPPEPALTTDPPPPIEYTPPPPKNVREEPLDLGPNVEVVVAVDTGDWGGEEAWGV